MLYYIRHLYKRIIYTENIFDIFDIFDIHKIFLLYLKESKYFKKIK